MPAIIGNARARSRRRRPGGAFLTLVAIVAAIVLIGSPAGAAAQAPGTSDPAAKEKAQQEQSKTRREQIAGQIDVLKASDTQLRAELDRLEARVRDEDAKAATARTGRDAATDEVAKLRVEVDRAEHDVEEWRAVAADRAVAAYMRPQRESASSMFAAKDPQELGRMKLLVSHVSRHDRDILTARKEAETTLKVRKAQADDAQARADEFARTAEASLAEATSLRSQRAAVHDELQHRIGSLQGEARALEAHEASLTALIRQRQAAATTTTTAAPTTTTSTTAAPTTTVAGRPASPAATTTTTKAPTTTKPPAPSRPKVGLSWPVGGTVTSGFGPRWGAMHRGIDIAAGMGTPIRAAADGVVFFSGEMGGYGFVVLVDHGNGISTVYAHASQLVAGNGARVSRGQTVALVGSTGHSTGPHLHFEVRVNGTAVDPMGYLG